MFKSKKFIVIAVIGLAIIGGSIGGAVMADDGDEDSTGPGLKHGGNLERVCEIYQENTGDTIDCDELQDAIAQARQEEMTEARDQMRQRLIDEGSLTEEELEEYEAWLADRPERNSEEFNAWLEDRPDIEMPFGPGIRDGMLPFGGGIKPFGHGGRFFHFGGSCAPDS